MTSGKPVKLILLFALPLIVGNIFQQFYSMADTVIVGRTIGVNALAAVGCTGSVSFFILGFVMGFTRVCRFSLPSVSVRRMRKESVAALLPVSF